MKIGIDSSEFSVGFLKHITTVPESEQIISEMAFRR